MIQHRAACFVLNKPWNRHRRDSITDMLKELNWPSLQERRKQSHLILMYKIVNDLLIVPDRCLPTPSPITRTRAHHPQKFLHLQSTVDIYRYSFLPRTINTWTGALDSGLGVDVIYLDYFKAFDSVPHLRLISKLQAYGIRGNLLKWIENFLIGRQQKVILNGSSSKWNYVTSGVPQGSVLGPLLFILYVIDITDGLQSTLD